jgi:Flp pilus assembly protein TadG
VEYAFILIFFLSLIFGIGGFGHALYAYHFVNHSAKEATRWAAVNGFARNADSSCTLPATSTDVTTFVKNRIPQGIDPAKVTVTTTWPTTAASPQICTGGPGIPAKPNAPTCTVEVQVQYTFNLIFPLIPTSPINLSSTSEMIIAH